MQIITMIRKRPGNSARKMANHHEKIIATTIQKETTIMTLTMMIKTGKKRVASF